MFHKRALSHLYEHYYLTLITCLIEVMFQRVRVSDNPESDGVHEEGAGLLPDLVPLHAVHTPAPPGQQQYWI